MTLDIFFMRICFTAHKNETTDRFGISLIYLISTKRFEYSNHANYFNLFIVPLLINEHFHGLAWTNILICLNIFSVHSFTMIYNALKIHLFCH